MNRAKQVWCETTQSCHQLIYRRECWRCRRYAPPALLDAQAARPWRLIRKPDRATRVVHADIGFPPNWIIFAEIPSEDALFANTVKAVDYADTVTIR